MRNVGGGVLLEFRRKSLASSCLILSLAYSSAIHLAAAAVTAAPHPSASADSPQPGAAPTRSRTPSRPSAPPASMPAAAPRQGIAVDPGPAGDRMPVRHPSKSQTEDRMVHDPSSGDANAR